MRIATYNVHGCVGIDRRYAPDRIAGVIAELGADIVGLQEIDSRRPHHAGMHQFDYLKHATSLAAIAGPNIRGPGGEYGNAILTRWPAAAIRRHDLSVRRYEPRGALDVDIETPHGLLRVVVTHLGVWIFERRAQTLKLLEALQPLSDRPTVLMGDFNHLMPRGGLQLRRLARFFAAGYGGRTFPSLLPLLELDRVYAHPLPARASARIHATPLARFASDHLPVVVELDWDAWPHQATDGVPVTEPFAG